MGRDGGGGGCSELARLERANGGHRTEMASGSAFQYSTLATLVETPLPLAPTSFLHPPVPFPSAATFFFVLSSFLLRPRSRPSNVRSLSLSLLSLCALSSLSPCRGSDPPVSVLRSFYFALGIPRFSLVVGLFSSFVDATDESSFRETDGARGDGKREAPSTVRF